MALKEKQETTNVSISSTTIVVLVLFDSMFVDTGNLYTVLFIVPYKVHHGQKFKSSPSNKTLVTTFYLGHTKRLCN